MVFRRKAPIFKHKLVKVCSHKITSLFLPYFYLVWWDVSVKDVIYWRTHWLHKNILQIEVCFIVYYNWMHSRLYKSCIQKYGLFILQVLWKINLQCFILVWHKVFNNYFSACRSVRELIKKFEYLLLILLKNKFWSLNWLTSHSFFQVLINFVYFDKFKSKFIPLHFFKLDIKMFLLEKCYLFSIHCLIQLLPQHFLISIWKHSLDLHCVILDCLSALIAFE